VVGRGQHVGRARPEEFTQSLSRCRRRGNHSLPRERHLGMIALIAPLMPRRVSPSGFVIRLDRWIAALRILNNSAAEAEEMWDEPSMG